MAKEYKHAGLMCLILAVLSLTGAVIGVLKSLPVLIICTTVPVAIYETYRTEGFFTKILSVGILAGLIAELLIIFGKFNFASAKIIDYATQKTAQYQVALKHLPVDKNPLAKFSLLDMRLFAPALLVVLSLLLLKKTGGIYTRILAALILICAVALAAAVKPELLKLVFG